MEIVKDVKYYSIILYKTRNVSRVDQMSTIIRREYWRKT